MKCCRIDEQNFPTITKCCFCVPIRKGVIIFGYFNLIVSLLSFPILIFLLVEELAGKPSKDDNRSHVDPLVHLPLTIAFVIVDVVMTIVLLVGAHTKNLVVLRVYLYFDLVFQLLTLCTDLIYFDYREYIENFVYFFFLGLNIYLIFLVYNTIRLIKNHRDVQYVSYRESQINL